MVHFLPTTALDQFYLQTRLSVTSHITLTSRQLRLTSRASGSNRNIVDEPSFLVIAVVVPECIATIKALELSH
jgi:hypothetical protein